MGTLKKYFFIFFKTCLKIILVYIVYSALIVLLLRWFNPPTTAYIQQKTGETFFSIFHDDDVKIKWMPLDKISKKAVLAVVASEDQKFLDHSGFDVEQIKIAMEEIQKGKRVRGASTVTQQTAKNLFLWTDKNLIRKGFEAYYTVLLELFWSKRRIMEIYLNTAEMGKNVYGFEAASNIYLKKSSANLSIQEAAVMAAVLPSPGRRSIKAPSKFVLMRAAGIIRKMQQLGGVNFLKPLYE